jgi:hypothetical protein
MYSPVIIDMLSAEQNRRIGEQQSIARSWNQVERQPLNLFGWIQSIYAGFSRKQCQHSVPDGNIRPVAEVQRE